MKRRNFFTSLVVLLLLGAVSLFAVEAKVVKKSFSGVKKIKMDLILGDCIIEKSSDASVHVTLEYTYSNGFEHTLKQRNGKLVLEERFRNKKNNDGNSKWTVQIPDGLDIDFKTATGDLSVSRIDVYLDGNTGTGDITLKKATGEFDLNTGTGNIEVEGCKGDFELNSGTGNVTLEASEGNFDANSGTGNVEANAITLDYEGDFNSGTGDAEVVGISGSDFELSINSGTDSAVLDMDGKPFAGYFEMKAHNRLGKIISPEKFDREDLIEEGDNSYVIKSFSRSGKTPRYYISTGTGKAVLRK